MMIPDALLAIAKPAIPILLVSLGFVALHIVLRLALWVADQLPKLYPLSVRVMDWAYERPFAPLGFVLILYVLSMSLLRGR